MAYQASPGAVAEHLKEVEEGAYQEAESVGSPEVVGPPVAAAPTFLRQNVPTELCRKIVRQVFGPSYWSDEPISHTNCK